MGIAVLLGAGDGDRYAVLHSIALAKRTGECVHVIRSAPDKGHKSAAGQTLLLQLADSAGITVHCHFLERKTARNMVALLREQRIFCLIVGAGNGTERRRAEKRLENLRRHISVDTRWSMRSFWAMVTGPWSDEAIAAELGR